MKHLFWCFEKNICWQNHENSCWILALFLSEAVEARLCYFFENCLIKTKCHNLLNRPPKIWNWKSQSVHLSEPIYFVHFNVRHPVYALDLGREVPRTEEKRWGKTITAQCFPLQSVLVALGNPIVDYFSLDVEGSEFPILKSLDWDNVNISIISGMAIWVVKFQRRDTKCKVDCLTFKVNFLFKKKLYYLKWYSMFDDLTLHWIDKD